MAERGDWLDGKGKSERREVLDAYIARLLEGLAGIAGETLSALRIGWDAGTALRGRRSNCWLPDCLVSIIASTPKSTGTFRTIIRTRPRRRIWQT